MAMYLGLRGQALSLDPEKIGMRPSPELPHVWGALMEIGWDVGSVSVLALADGTASLYTSAGPGVIGGGFHPTAKGAALDLLNAIEEHLSLFPKIEDSPLLFPEISDVQLPVLGEVRFIVLTFEGKRIASARENDLGAGNQALSPIFYAGHHVITELRLIAEAKSGT